jgi:outer membrane receptor protein involved in Fe transport
VLRGASSSLYDNYALGGMVHFRTRRGSDINGFETFLSGGSYGFFKQAFAVGQQFENLDVSLFASNAAEDGFIRNSDYNTQTLNFNLRFTIDDKQSSLLTSVRLGALKRRARRASTIPTAPMPRCSISSASIAARLLAASMSDNSTPIPCSPLKPTTT